MLNAMDRLTEITIIRGAEKSLDNLTARLRKLVIDEPKPTVVTPQAAAHIARRFGNAQLARNIELEEKLKQAGAIYGG